MWIFEIRKYVNVREYLMNELALPTHLAAPQKGFKLHVSLGLNHFPLVHE